MAQMSSGRRTSLGGGILAALLVVSSPASAAAAGPGNGRNLLLITVDTLRADHLGCYGCAAVQTPFIDGLARGGVRFERAFAHTTTTLPSHTNILLGLTPLAHGVHDNSNFIVRPEFTTLAEWLKGAGYATGAVIGAFPLDSRFGLNQGFDVYDDNYGSQSPDMLSFVERKAEVVVTLALEWLKARDGRTPWFLWIHLYDPHQPWQPPEPFRSQYKEDPYCGEIAYTDQALGKLLGYLKETDLERTTAVVFTADHGEGLGDHGEMTHGYFAYNATLRIPLLISAPGIKPAFVSANVGHVDIFPTVCDLLKIDKPSGLSGVSLLPLIQGKEAPDRPLYFEALNAFCNRGWAPLRGYIERNEKFIDLPIPELYDLAADFPEKANLAEGRPLGSYRKRLADLQQALSSTLENMAAKATDAQTLKKLRSLGYIAAPQAPRKKTYTAADDLKTLLPYHEKWMKATLLHESGRPREAIELLKEIVTERKDFDLAFIYLANFYKEEGRPEDAVSVLRVAYEFNPESFTIMTGLGIRLVEVGRFDEAIDLLHKALGIIDYDPEAWNYLGVAFWNKGDNDEARKAYQRALALDSNDAIVLNNLGSLDLSIYLKTQAGGSLDEAIADFRKAIEFDPHYASAYNGLGAAFKMAGDPDGAIAAWTKAVELKPDFGYPLYNLGLSLLAKGDKAGALGYFTRYKELNYSVLSSEDKKKLDDFIERCR